MKNFQMTEKMKNIYRLGAAAMVTILAAGCQEKEQAAQPGTGEGTREITVFQGASTKTTIDYEGSDVSHLVWQDGDAVLYITNDSEGLYDYGFQKATVDSNKFTATISSKATAENKILVAWPSSETSLGSDQTIFYMKETVSQASTDKFNGKLLPMIALMDVPTGNTVNALYTPLASVLRVSIDSTNHAGELLKSVKITTAEQCRGNYVISTSQEGGYTYKGRGESVTVNLSDTPELRSAGYVYIVLNRAAYTGVKLEVTTDKKTYTFEDGKMDLSVEGRVLYRLNVSLPSESTGGDDSKEDAFVKVTDASQLVDGGQYLIVAPKSAGSYYIMAPSGDGQFLDADVIEYTDAEKIAKTTALMEYAVTLEAGTGDYAGKFALNYKELGSKPYVCAPRNVSSALSYHGYFNYFATTGAATMESQPWWTITPSADKTAITSHQLMSGSYGSLCCYTSDKTFGVCVEGSTSQEDYPYSGVLLYKLN